MTRPLSFALALALSAGTLVACGGDDEDEKDKGTTAAESTAATTAAEPPATSSDKAPTKTEFIAKADRICAISRRETQQLANRLVGNPGGKPPTAEQYQKILEASLPIARATGEQLDELPRPKGDEQEIQRFIDSGFELIERFKAAAKTPEGAEEVFSGEQDVDEESDKLAQAYGFKVCGSDEQ